MGEALPTREPLVLDGRFEATRLLKEGHGVATWLGRERSSGSPVVMKVAQPGALSPGAALRLEHEARALKAVDSPYVPQPLAAGTAEGTAWMVLPFLEGQTLRHRLDSGPRPVLETLDMIRGLFAGLEVVHAAGVLHRDIKPENLVVQPGPEGEPRLRMIDFGLARSGQMHSDLHSVPAGTALYMAPEQAGFLSRDVGEAADLYSAGAVLFECLAGRPPFEGSTVGEVLRGHLTRTPPLLRGMGLDVPRALDEVVQRLLQKDPEHRYGSAAAVEADLEEIARALREGVADPPVAVGRADVRRTLAEPSFVGRAGERQVLAEALEEARGGRAGVILVEAPSGGGKTRLLQEVAFEALRRGTRVFRGGAREQEAPEPFRMLSGVASDLGAAAASDPDFAEHLRATVGDWADAVVAALPSLGPVLGVEAAREMGPEVYGARRTMRALGVLLAAASTLEAPALVVLDDAQWADETTVSLLRFWAQERVGRTLLVVAFRSEEVGADHPLRQVAGPSLRLAPLSESELEQMLRSMAGAVPQDALQPVTSLAEGSPYMAVEVLRGMVETGVISGDREGWTVERDALVRLQSSRRAAALLARRLEVLPPAVLGLLAVAAVVGREFDLGLAGALAGLEPGEAISLLAEARRRRLVWMGPAGVSYAFVHDRLREALLGRLTPEERTELHRRAGEYLESRHPGRLYDLAYHFHRAGLDARALPYALRAAEEARSRHTLDIAEDQYRIAAAAAVEEGTRLRVLEGLGDVLMLRGRYGEAADQLRDARGLAREPVAQARLEGKLGELAFKQGDVQEAGRLIEGALRLLGHRVPGGRPAMVLHLLREGAVQALHSAAPGRLGRRSLDQGEADLLVAHLYNRLSYTWWFNRPVEALLWVHLRHLNGSEAYPPTPVRAQACSNHGVALTNVPWFARSLDYARRGLEMRRSLGDRWGEGQALNFFGLALYAASRFDEALERLREAYAILERTGDLWELNFARYHIALCLYRKGDLQAAAEETREAWRRGREIGDPQASGISVSTLVRVSAGEVAREDVEAELRAVEGDAQTTALLLEGEGIRLLSLGRVEEACATLDQAVDLVARAGKRNEYVASIPAWQATARRVAVERVPRCHPARARRLRRAARQACRAAVAMARTYRNSLPHALRESGLLAACEGSARRARAWLDRSLAAAEELGMAFERALTLREVARLGAELGWPDAEEAGERARRALAAMRVDFPAEAPVPRVLALAPADAASLSLADRLSVVLEDGRRVATALTRSEVLEALHGAALTVLRGQECAVLEVGPDAPLAPVAGTLDLEMSRSLVETALATRRPVRLSGSMPDPSDSVIFAGSGSALCAPVLVEGQPEALFYVVHRQVGDLYGQEEERVAGFLAALAGTALENAASHRRILDEQEARHAEELKVQGLEARKNALVGFLSIASHDLGNLLAVTSLYAQQLEPGLPAERLELCRDTVKLACRRAEGLIRVYLDAARAEAGRPLALQPEGIDLARLAAEEVDFRLAVEDMDTGRRRLVEQDLAPAPAWADPDRIRQVVANLVGNALKFNRPEGRIRVRVRPEGDRALFEVEDEGPGIAPEDQERLFQPFERLGARKPGAGVGLWICRVVVDAHGGEIGVRSEPGRGSSFWFALPAGPPLESPSVAVRTALDALPLN